MNTVICERCGSNDLYEDNGFLICRYCGTRHFISNNDTNNKESNIELNEDVAALLQKCRNDPYNAAKYARLILQIDPNNVEAATYLYGEINDRVRKTAVEKSQVEEEKSKSAGLIIFVSILVLILFVFLGFLTS